MVITAQKINLIVAACLVASCRTKKDDGSSKRRPVGTPTIYTDSNLNPDDKKTNKKKEPDAITPPGNVTGAYLICE